MLLLGIIFVLFIFAVSMVAHYYSRYRMVLGWYKSEIMHSAALREIMTRHQVEVAVELERGDATVVPSFNGRFLVGPEDVILVGAITAIGLGRDGTTVVVDTTSGQKYTMWDAGGKGGLDARRDEAKELLDSLSSEWTLRVKG